MDGLATTRSRVSTLVPHKFCGSAARSRQLGEVGGKLAKLQYFLKGQSPIVQTGARPGGKSGHPTMIST